MRLQIASVLLAVAVGGCYATTDVGYSGGYRAGYVAPAPVYTTSATVSVDTYEPDLVDVGGGVQVIADYDEPVFYTDNYYWRFYGGTWYRSNVYSGGWTVYNDVPYSVRRIERPHSYVRYRPQGYTPRARREPYRQPAVRDHREPYRQPGYDRRDYRPAPGPAVRDHRDPYRPAPAAEPYRPAPGPAVRDHRDPYRPAPAAEPYRPAPGPAVRDHRTAPAPAPATRDYRARPRPRRRAITAATIAATIAAATSAITAADRDRPRRGGRSGRSSTVTMPLRGVSITTDAGYADADAAGDAISARNCASSMHSVPYFFGLLRLARARVRDRPSRGSGAPSSRPTSSVPPLLLDELLELLARPRRARR